MEKILGKFGVRVGRIVVRVLDDSLADFEGQIQSSEGRVTELEILDDAQRVKVVIERKSMLPHGRVERFFSRVAEGRMADVVDQGQRFDQIRVEAELRGDGARNLGDLDGVRQSITEMVGIAAHAGPSLGQPVHDAPQDLREGPQLRDGEKRANG